MSNFIGQYLEFKNNLEVFILVGFARLVYEGV